jgi:hypothetical protein
MPLPLRRLNIAKLPEPLPRALDTPGRFHLAAHETKYLSKKQDSVQLCDNNEAECLKGRQPGGNGGCNNNLCTFPGLLALSGWTGYGSGTGADLVAINSCSSFLYFRGGARPAIERQVAHSRRGQADRGERREVAGALSEGLAPPGRSRSNPLAGAPQQTIVCPTFTYFVASALLIGQ